MKVKATAYIMAAIASASGIVVLMGYFLPSLKDFQGEILHWSMIFSAVLLLVGVISLINTHWVKIRQDQKNRPYSLVLLASFVLTVLVAAPTGPTSKWSLWLYDSLLVPIESSLLGILAITLVYACARMFNQRMSIYTLIFVGTVLLALVGAMTIPGVDLAAIKGSKDWLTGVLAVAGGRGILFGVGLGTVATALRVLIGSDRPYGG